jgi:hypothetical protein
MAAIVSQIVVETLVQNTPVSYVSQIITESLVKNNPLLYLTQLTSEVAVKNNPLLYLTQLTNEVALQGNPSLYLTQLVTEVAYPNPGVGTVPGTGALTTQYIVEVVTTGQQLTPPPVTALGIMGQTGGMERFQQSGGFVN